MRVFVVGDSIAFGLGDNERLGWVNRLPVVDDVQYFNLGVPGHTMGEILERAYYEVSARMVSYHDNLIIIGGGLNDLCMDDQGNLRTDVDTLTAQIHALIGAMQKLAPTLVVGPFPIDEEFNPYFVATLGQDMMFKNILIEQASQIYTEACKTQDVPYLDMYKLLKDDASYLGALRDNDGIHPDEMGYVGAAEYISNWKALRSQLPDAK